MTAMPPSHARPNMPRPRGPFGEALAAHLRRPPHPFLIPPAPDGDPLADDDLHLSLYTCYELHYRGWGGVDEAWEWEPSVVAARRALERRFEDALRIAIGPEPPPGPASIARRLREIVQDDPWPSLSRHLERDATMEEFREFVVHRSAYHLKEADPHTWAIPRIDGSAKAALVELQADEYGGGRAERMHSVLFATTMRRLGLDDAYGAYVDLLPGSTVATVNLMSLFGLHRRWRGALVGHLAAFEMTSPLPNRRYGNALRRLGFGPEATAFYDEHVEADAVHEEIAAHDVAAALATAAPDLAADVLFGARALLLLEGLAATAVLGAWADGRSSLRQPLAPARVA